MRKILFIFLISILLSLKLNAQEQNYKNTISFVPSYLINSGIRLDYERTINRSNHLVLGSQFYYRDIVAEETLGFRGIDEGKLRGAGLEVNYKHLLLPELKIYDNAYYSVGLSYQFFKLENTESSIERSIGLHKAGTHFIIGYQLQSSSRVVFDIYSGLGFRYTFDGKSENNMTNTFNDYSWNFGYSGPVFMIGIKIGILL